MEKRGTKRPHEDTYSDIKVIYFDLETTGFNGQICSMAFLSSDGGSKFTEFLIPKSEGNNGKQNVCPEWKIVSKWENC